MVTKLTPKEEQYRHNRQRPQTLPKRKLRRAGDLVILVSQAGALLDKLLEPHGADRILSISSGRE